MIKEKCRFLPIWNVDSIKLFGIRFLSYKKKYRRKRKRKDGTQPTKIGKKDQLALLSGANWELTNIMTTECGGTN